MGVLNILWFTLYPGHLRQLLRVWDWEWLSSTLPGDWDMLSVFFNYLMNKTRWVLGNLMIKGNFILFVSLSLGQRLRRVIVWLTSLSADPGIYVWDLVGLPISISWCLYWVPHEKEQWQPVLAECTTLYVRIFISVKAFAIFFMMLCILSHWWFDSSVFFQTTSGHLLINQIITHPQACLCFYS